MALFRIFCKSRNLRKIVLAKFRRIFRSPEPEADDSGRRTPVTAEGGLPLTGWRENGTITIPTARPI